MFVDITYDPMSLGELQRPAYERRASTFGFPSFCLGDTWQPTCNHIISYKINNYEKYDSTADFQVSVFIPDIHFTAKEMEDTSPVIAASLPARIEHISQAMGLSKTFLSQILGVSRQTIYDWLEGGASIKDENLQKIEWLEALNSNLSSDIRTGLWLWKKRILPQSNMSVEKTILDGKEDPMVVAKWISDAVAGWASIEGADIPRRKDFKAFLDEHPNPVDSNS